MEQSRGGGKCFQKRGPEQASGGEWELGIGGVWGAIELKLGIHNSKKLEAQPSSRVEGSRSAEARDRIWISRPRVRCGENEKNGRSSSFLHTLLHFTSHVSAKQNNVCCRSRLVCTDTKKNPKTKTEPRPCAHLTLHSLSPLQASKPQTQTTHLSPNPPRPAPRR